MTAGAGPRSGAVRLEPVGDLTAVRAEWSALAERCGNVFGTWEWAAAWQRHLGASAPGAAGAPAVALARGEDGRAIAVLPLHLSLGRPLRLLRFLGAGPSDHLGPVCAEADRPAAVAALRRHVDAVLAGRGVFIGERLRADEGVGAQLGAVALRRAASPVLPIRGRSFEEFLASRSRNFRSQVRRHERRLERAYRVRYRLSTDPERLPADVEALIRLHGARWASGQSRTFRGGRMAFHREFAQRALEQGWLRLWTLELDGRPAAVWYGLRYGGIETYYQAGREPALDRLHVGFVLLCHTIRCAFEDGMREYRFGLGGEAYKSRFTTHDPGLETVALTAGRSGRLALASLRAALRARDGLRERRTSESPRPGRPRRSR